MTDQLPSPSDGKFLFYDTEDGKTRVQVLLDGKTCWMPQSHIAELFETTKQNVSLHIQNIYAEGELVEAATVKDYLTVQKEGNREVKRNLQIYNLEMIIAIGYRVRSTRGTQFRRWATATLNEFLVKGFVLDDERLKAAETTFGKDYFDELLERTAAIGFSLAVIELKNPADAWKATQNCNLTKTKSPTRLRTTWLWSQRWNHGAGDHRPIEWWRDDPDAE